MNDLLPPECPKNLFISLGVLFRTAVKGPRQYLYDNDYFLPAVAVGESSDSVL